MLKGEQGRIGIAKAYYDCGFGPAARARSEKADSVWILSAHATKAESWLAEQVAAAKFGLPQIIFELTGQKTNISQEAITAALQAIGPNLDRVDKCLAWHGRDLAHPMWIKGEYNYVAARRPFVTAAQNLLPGVMSVLVYADDKTGSWEPLDVKRFSDNCEVYSLEVDTHELYVADGLLTHNSIYGFRGADSSSMPNLKKEFNTVTLPLSISYRCPIAIVAEAQKFVDHIQSHPSAPQGVVDPKRVVQ